MPRSRDDDLAWESEQPRAPRASRVRGLLDDRTLTLAAGFVLAVAATLAVFLTDDRQYLRVAVVAVAWAFVIAAVAAGRRTADGAAAAVREAQLRHAYELELEREVAARREYELALERDLRREAEDAMRDELDALRDELASLSSLRDEVARVSDLRHDLAGLAALRDDVARVASLREDVAALSALRQDLGQLAELRADLGRLRAELTEQLSSEMLVERITMRTQGSRFDPPGRSLDVPTRWSEDTPPRELTGGWPAIRLDDQRETRSAEPVRADRSLPAPPPTASMRTAGPAVSAFDRPPPAPEPPAHRQPRNEREDPPGGPGNEAWRPQSTPPETPIEWLTARSLLEPESRPAPPPPVPPVQVPQAPATQVPQAPATEARPAYRPSPHPRPRPTPPPPSVRLQPDLAPIRRRTDEADTAERPAAVGGSPSPAGSGGAEPARDAGPVPSGDGRLAEILAENGVSPATGSRRRHRYREDGEPDDVLARVLGLR